MIKSDYIVFDCETGGLDPKANPITQYAAVILDGITLKEKDRFETYIKLYGDLVIEKDAIKHTMVSMADVNNGMKIADFVAAVTKWWNGYIAVTKSRDAGRLVAVGHNVPFDIGFVNAALRHVNRSDSIYKYIQPNFIDTYALGKMTWGLTGKEKLNLTACCGYAGITLKDAHGAMNDVEATAELFRYFVKKMRSKAGKKNSSGESKADEGRPRGDLFFEFKCAE